MELQLTSKTKQRLIDCITKYYSSFDIRSIGRMLEIDETEYFSPMMPNKVLADEFITRVFQLSKQADMLDIIKNHSTLNRKQIINDLNIVDEVFTNKTDDKTNIRNIIHLSDIHLGTLEDSQRYRLQLNTDLALALNIEKIDFLVLSGDISHRATEEQYNAAVLLVESIILKFNIDRNKIIIVPGNHDVNWDISKKSAISSSEDSVLFDEEIYKLRFDNFNKYFYKKICKKTYPQIYSKQGLLYEYEKEKIIILGLNSAWQIDHINKYRSSIYINSLDDPLDKTMDKNYNDWLKIAVFHHPVKGKESMNDEFLQLLIRHNFKVCMHGHIHEAKYDFCSYGNDKEIAIIGAGTFGAPDEEHVLGVPLQYNFINLGVDNKKIRVITRRKENTDGAWEADARWGNKDKPVAFYDIDISKLHKSK